MIKGTLIILGMLIAFFTPFLLWGAMLSFVCMLVLNLVGVIALPWFAFPGTVSVFVTPIILLISGLITLSIGAISAIAASIK